MKNLLRVLFISAMLGGVHQIQAQEYASIQYVVAIPTNDLRDYISETSFRGAAIEYHSKITPNIALGGSIGWNSFYQKNPYGTYEDGTASLSGIQYRYSSAMPLYISGLYFFKEENTFDPFVGLGIGAVYTIRDTDMGIYRWEEDTWNFSLRPEVGLMFAIKDRVGAKLALRYNQAFKTDEMKDQSFFSFAIGVIGIR
jgi:outer membrane protein